MITEIQLYWVAWCKHDGPQFIEEGPYLNREDAEDALECLKKHEEETLGSVGRRFTWREVVSTTHMLDPWEKINEQ